MKYLSIVLLLSACQAMPPSFAVKDVRLFDGDDFHQQMTVVVREGRIAAVGNDLDLPSGTTIIDGHGKTLLPGLIDAHTHAFGEALVDALRFGVTTELDMFTDAEWAAARRREQKASPVTQRADLFSAGTLVTAPGGHGTEYGIAIPTLTNSDDAEAFVRARLDEGSDYIKIIIDDGAPYGLNLATLDQNTLHAVIRAAHNHDALAVVHVMTKDAATEAVSCGADGLMHIFADQAIDDALIEDILLKGCFVVPTLSTIESIAGHPGGSAIENDPQLAPFLSPEQRRNLDVSFPPAYGRQMKTSLANDTVRRLFLAGVPILAGTDAPNPGTAHGVSLHRELKLLVDAGLSPVDALRAATSRPADAFNLPDRGRIAPGLKADLVLVEGDAGVNIGASRNILSVWKDGVEVNREHQKTEVPSEETPRLKPGVVSDFDDGSLKISGGFGWTPSTDSMMGGTSTVDLAIEGGQDDGKYLRVRGTIAAGTAFPWAGPILFPGRQPMGIVDGTDVAMLNFSARGNGVLRVLVFAESLGWIPAEHSLHLDPRWKDFSIQFSTFEGVDRSGIKAILFSGGKEPGNFNFDLDGVGFQ